jgi:putative transposase
VVTPAGRHEAVAHLEEHYEMSERRACSVLGVDRSPVRYRHRRPDDAELRAALHETVEKHRRFGYRRLHVILRRDGHVLNRKRTQRLDREEGLAVRRRRSRKRALGTRAPLVTEGAANARWSVDFMQDQFADGRRFRILDVLDDVTKECLACVVDTSISGRRVARELTALIERREKPGVIVSDNGTEFTSNAILDWASKAQVKWHWIARGKPCRTETARPSTAGCATSRLTKPCSSASITPVRPSPFGPTPATLSVPTRLSATRPRRPSPLNSPQWAIGSAHLNRCADRPLLRRRNRAKFTRRLWSQIDELRGAQHSTVLTLDEAYNNARLLVRPDREWLEP